ncbi:MAG: CatB-related O-acetyltransferase [Steroidobacteraceae bacterium]
MSAPSGNSLCSSLRLLVFKLLKKARLTAVRSSQVHPTSKIESGTTFYFSRMEKYSFCGYDCEILYADIGSFTSIANGVVVGGGRHPMEWVGMSPVFYEGRDSVTTKFSTHSREAPLRTRIGHDVWIGRSAILLPGVSIGNGAVVGAGAVVTKPVLPYAIVAGNPARLIRYRFNEDIIARLQAIQWWSLDEQRLRELGPYFNDVEKFLAVVERV